MKKLVCFFLKTKIASAAAPFANSKGKAQNKATSQGTGASDPSAKPTEKAKGVASAANPAGAGLLSSLKWKIYRAVELRLAFLTAPLSGSRRNGGRFGVTGLPKGGHIRLRPWRLGRAAPQAPAARGEQD